LLEQQRDRTRGANLSPAQREAKQLHDRTRLANQRERTATTKELKEKYLREFDSEKNGELHEQGWVGPEIDAFHRKMAETKQFFCDNCNQSWPTTKDYCEHCMPNKDRFSARNDMQPNHELFSPDIKKLFEQLTMIEKMLISPILVVMSVFRLPGGQTYTSGNVANFPQAVQEVCTEMPRIVSELPLLIVRNTDQNNLTKELIVDKNRVETILRYVNYIIINNCLIKL
jgi:hypothetical protein